MSISFARGIALVLGLLLPVVETIRRWHQLGDIAIWPAWLDDWAIGALLLYGWWRTRTTAAAGMPALAAGFGFASAMAWSSFFSQLSELDRADPSGVSPVLVVSIKGAGFVLFVVALLSILTWKPRPQ